MSLHENGMLVREDEKKGSLRGGSSRAVKHLVRASLSRVSPMLNTLVSRLLYTCRAQLYYCIHYFEYHEIHEGKEIHVVV